MDRLGVLPLDDNLNRRVLLGAAGTAGVIALGGCLGSEDKNSDSGTVDAETGDTETAGSEIPDLPDGLSESGVDYEALIDTHADTMSSQSFTLHTQEVRDGQLYVAILVRVDPGDERIHLDADLGPDAGDHEEIEEFVDGQTHYVLEDGEMTTGESSFEEQRENITGELTGLFSRLSGDLEFTEPEYADGAFVTQFDQDHGNGFDIEDGYLKVNEDGTLRYMELEGESGNYSLEISLEDVGETTVEKPDWV